MQNCLFSVTFLKQRNKLFSIWQKLLNTFDLSFECNAERLLNVTQRQHKFQFSVFWSWLLTIHLHLVSYFLWDINYNKYLYWGSTSDNNFKYLYGKKWIEQILIFEACKEYILFLIVCNCFVYLKKFSILGEHLLINFAMLCENH